MRDLEPVVITAAVTTRNRPEALARCLASLAALGDLVGEILVADDASRESPETLLPALPEAVRRKTTVLAMPEGPGYIVGRNRLARAASHDFVLFLDDDAFVLDPEAIGKGAELIARDPSVGAVAFAQAEADGRAWPASMQPAPVSYCCYVPAYIGFAHLLRRAPFLAAGGYDESFVFYGEEKDWCLRALDAGLHVVFMPDARVAHVPDPSGRDPVRYLRRVTRNDCLFALRREPLPMPVISVPLRMRRYLFMRRHGRVEDPGGFWWLLREVLAAVPSAGLRGRVRWSTIATWRRLQRLRPAYEAPTR